MRAITIDDEQGSVGAKMQITGRMRVMETCDAVINATIRITMTEQRLAPCAIKVDIGVVGFRPAGAADECSTPNHPREGVAVALIVRVVLPVNRRLNKEVVAVAGAAPARHEAQVDLSPTRRQS